MEKKWVCVSEYIGRIDGHGLLERNGRSIYKFGNSELPLSVIYDIIPELNIYFPDHWPEIIAMSMFKAQDNRIRYRLSDEIHPVSDREWKSHTVRFIKHILTVREHQSCRERPRSKTSSYRSNQFRPFLRKNEA